MKWNHDNIVRDVFPVILEREKEMMEQHQSFKAKSNHSEIDTMKLIIKAIVRERREKIGSDELFDKMLNNNKLEDINTSTPSDENRKPLSKTLDEKARDGGKP